MHRFLRSVGFKRTKTGQQEKELIEYIKNNPTQKTMVGDPGNSFMTYSEMDLEIVPGMGVKVSGRFDDEDNFYFDHYMPYLKGERVSTVEDCFISKKMDSMSFSGLADDPRLGVSLIFQVINGTHMMDNWDLSGERELDNRKIRLSALCSEGIVILPTTNTSVSADLDGLKKRMKMLAKAREGDREAMEALTIEEMDTYANLGNRIADEDILSIVESSIIPFGMETEIYKVLGVIEDVKLVENKFSSENVYILKVKCNSIPFDICINEDDLAGEPLPGRRFRGIIWMQGFVDGEGF